MNEGQLDSSFTSSLNKSNEEENRKRILLGDLNNFIEENDKCITFNVTSNLEPYNTNKYTIQSPSFNAYTYK